MWVGGVGPQVNKFEQVPRSDVWGWGWRSGGGVGYPRGVLLPCDLSHDACDITYSPTPMDRMTDRRL